MHYTEDFCVCHCAGFLQIGSHIHCIHTYFNCVLFFISAAKPNATAQPAEEQFLISPITGECVPASKMADHMRYGMCDIISYY